MAHSTTPRYHQDSSAKLDYVFDWSDLMDDAETISDKVVTSDVGITATDGVVNGQTVRVWISGGTAGVIYAVRCKVVTSGGREDERTIEIAVVDH